MPQVPLQERILGLVLPAVLLFHAVQAYILTLLDGLISKGTISPDLRDKAFGRFWEKISGVPADPSVPLVGSAALVPPLFAQASGIVLEIGPGSGNQTQYYEPASSQIRRIYGAEPARELHSMLRRNVDATRLGGKYRILSAGGSKVEILEQLRKDGNDDIISKDVLFQKGGIFDTIICVRVLCSVPDLDQTVSDLYDLLKPGGRLLITEHTVNAWRTRKGSLIARVCQTGYELIGWRYFVGNCELTRDIEGALRTDAKRRWESVDLERYFGHAVLTYISGVLVKKA